MSEFVREKPIIALAVVLILGIALGAVQKNAVRKGRTSFVQEFVRALSLPFSFGARGVLITGTEVRNAARPKSRILKENESLREQVKQLTLENMQLRAKAHENIELRKELGLKEVTGLKMTAAEVIGRKESAWFDTASINVGEKQGIKTAAAVVNHYGLIGQVLLTNKYTSEIVALTNPGSAVGAMIERSRCAGIVQGTGFDYLVMSYLAKDADVQVGDIVVTSGMGKVIPKGFIIGKVTEVHRSMISMTTSATVEPSVPFDRIEFVYVVGREGEPK